MSTTLTSVRTLAVGVALMLGAAGCSSSSDSDAPNSAVSTAGASNSSSAAYVFDVVNFAWTEPAAGAIASLKRSDCEFCDKLEDYAGVLSASQRRFESDPFTVEAPIALKA